MFSLKLRKGSGTVSSARLFHEWPESPNELGLKRTRAGERSEAEVVADVQAEVAVVVAGVGQRPEEGVADVAEVKAELAVEGAGLEAGRDVDLDALAG